MLNPPFAAIRFLLLMLNWLPIFAPLPQLLLPHFTPPMIVSVCDMATVNDFAERDTLPESDAPREIWYSKFRHDGWGPHAAQYPAVKIPKNCNAQEWQRARVIAIAERYIGLSYQHHHIPTWNPREIGTGLDCSNFTAWVYNYGLGIKFTSALEAQAVGAHAPGRVLRADEPRRAGDLIFLFNQKRTRISHVVIYLDTQHIIDAHNDQSSNGVQVREIKGWYATHQALARRIIE
ncbi:MAG TPA: NlpC/P60 family protein [Anaerolineae bacterium]|nr:NlpC/P60 family protein [Anaerolineae bacterium]